MPHTAARRPLAAGGCRTRGSRGSAPMRVLGGSALVSMASGLLARPLTKRTPFVYGGRDAQGRQVAPTVVLNAETVWRVARIADRGSAWFRPFGTPAEPGPRLVTIGGSVHSPGSSPPPPAYRSPINSERPARRARAAFRARSGWAGSGASSSPRRRRPAPSGPTPGSRHTAGPPARESSTSWLPTAVHLRRCRHCCPMPQANPPGNAKHACSGSPRSRLSGPS